jgi:hypothetical protein
MKYYRAKSGVVADDLLPEKINDLIRQMSDFLTVRIEEDTPYRSAWENFVANPEDGFPSLEGSLEALFEAQPGIRKRVDGFMQKITAIEAENSDLEYTQKNIESDLKSRPVALVPDEAENSAIMADEKDEKTPPIYLYGNGQEGFEYDREKSVSNPFMVGENAQIIYIPDEEMQFPFMFMHLGRLSDTSTKLNLNEKEIVQENLQIIRFQLTEKRPYDEEKMANAFEKIWEVAPSYANVLIESLQRNINELPIKTREFIIQLSSPLH